MDAGLELAVGRGAVDDRVRALTQIVRVTVDELKLPLDTECRTLGGTEWQGHDRSFR